MVEGRLDLEPEVLDILRCIDEGKNFLLSGGAGSGKTYSLVSVIRQVLAENPTAKIACMTYTNSAVKEIEDRVSHKNLNVSTIHDFLWDNIKHYQKSLKAAIINMLNDPENTKFTIEGLSPVPVDYFDNLSEPIQYKEFVKLRDGIISHDEVILVANYLFAKHPKLCGIVKDKYKFIFIDEYQDTNKGVVEIFLIHFKNTNKNNMIGFFGDAMQSIYDNTVGDLNNYVQNGDVKEIKKEQNRRNPQLVIDLANKLRTDGIKQVPSSDLSAPNMLDGKVKQGTVLFLYSNDVTIKSVEDFLTKNYSWNFADSTQTKQLNLTHNLIADRAGFKSLMDIYGKDQIIKYRDKIKKYIKANPVTTDFTDKTFGEVIKLLKESVADENQKKILPSSGNMKKFIEDNSELFDYAKSLKYDEFSKNYISTDQLIDDKKQDEETESKKGSKRDNLIKHLFKIQTNISLYNNRKYNEFLRATDYRERLKSIADKRQLKSNIESLVNVGDRTIEQIIDEANKLSICIVDDRLESFKKNNKYLFHRVKDVKFTEFQNLFNYLEGQTPFSTKHKTKGAEFDNVLVILDNGGWNMYNFEKMFLGNASASVMERSQKLFYVCCTRAKNNLAVFFHKPSQEVIQVAKHWFGENSVINIDK